ncbi:MAG: hypothetical protein ABI551_24225, partial [Polyangiaceae bacterium]
MRYVSEVAAGKVDSDGGLEVGVGHAGATPEAASRRACCIAFALGQRASFLNESARSITCAMRGGS